jgi:hypothetical protein
MLMRSPLARDRRRATVHSSRASSANISFTSPVHHSRQGQWEGIWVDRIGQFDREYCQDVKSACLQAIANTSFRERANPHEMIPAAEVYVALIDIMGTIRAMVEESLPGDLQGWAEGLATQFAASFHATRASFTIADLDLLHSRE